MPTFTLYTNVSKSKIPSDFVTKTVDVIAKALGKPKSYVVVNVIPDQLMSWGGGDDPCGNATLSSIGALGKDANKKHSAILFKHINQHLGIESNHLYITYIDLHKENVGYDGTTFDELM